MQVNLDKVKEIIKRRKDLIGIHEENELLTHEIFGANRKDKNNGDKKI